VAFRATLHASVGPLAESEADLCVKRARKAGYSFASERQAMLDAAGIDRPRSRQPKHFVQFLCGFAATGEDAAPSLVTEGLDTNLREFLEDVVMAKFREAGDATGEGGFSPPVSPMAAPSDSTSLKRTERPE